MFHEFVCDNGAGIICIRVCRLFDVIIACVGKWHSTFLLVLF